MQTRRIHAVFWAASLIISGCAANDVQIKRLTEAETKLEHLMQANKRTDARLSEMSTKLQMMEDKLADSLAQSQKLQSSFSDLLNRNEELKSRVSVVSQPAAPKIEVVNPETPMGRESGPPPEYVKAFGLYSTNSFHAAIKAFQAFVKGNPKSEYSSNAVYWTGECYYGISDLNKALEYFRNVVDTYPKSAKAPDAMLKMGITLTGLKQHEKARAAFEKLVRQYPGSPAAVKARERLTSGQL